MKQLIVSGLTGLAVAVSGFAAETVLTAERPVCHLNDDGTWTAEEYDNARDGGHVMDRMANSDGTCSWPRVVPVTPPAPEVRTVVRTVVRTKVVRVRVMIRNGKRTVTRKVTWR